MSSPPIPGELLALQQAFAEELPGRVTVISNIWDAFQQHLDDEKRADEFYRMVHNLAGAGGTFGVMPVSHAAYELELAIKVLINDKSASQADHSMDVQDLINRLQDVAINWQPSAIPYLQQTRHSRPRFSGSRCCFA